MSRTHFRRIAAAAVAASVSLTISVPADAQVEPHPVMLRYPDVSADHIVFAYANDLWLVSKEGGEARPLASPRGQEVFPRFSADGRTIAFMGNYDGNRDLYTISVNGGVPVRVTHHPAAEVLSDWTPDNELLFWANGLGGLPRQTQLFTVAAGGGLPRRLPVPYGANGAISPDGRWLAYTPHSRDTRTWKRYRGGMATDIWLFDLRENTAERVTNWEGTDTQPMWYDGNLYYLTDAGPAHRLNIWSYDLQTTEHKQITQFSDYDVKWPSIGGAEVVFQNGSDLYLHDLSTNVSRVVDVAIPGDRPTIRTKQVDASKFSDWWHISPTGKRALIEARGDIWTAPAEHGSPRNLTRTDGAAERQPSWSPDGRWIAYFSDQTGEYELFITQSDGRGETRQLTNGSETYYTDPIWSPDCEYIVFTDKASKIYLHTLDSSETTVIDQDPYGQASRPSWSHDSQWLTYSRTDDDKPIAAIWLYHVPSGDRNQVTAGMFGDTNPTFDRQGDYIYFASGRSFRPTYSDVDTTFIYNQSQVLVAVPLRGDVESPWLPESDEETWDDEDDAEGEDADTEDAEGEDAEGENAEEEDASGDEETDEAPVVDDGLSGTWEGDLSGDGIPPGMDGLEFTMNLSLDGDSVTGSISVPMGTAEIDGTYDEATGRIEAELVTEEGDELVMTATVQGTSISGTITFVAQGMTLEFNGTRTATLAEGGGEKSGGSDGKKEKAAEKVEIDLEGFEQRGFMLPVKAGNFGGLVVNNKNQLIYARFSQGGMPEIMLFDLEDDKKKEKSVSKGVGGFEISADGKNLLLIRGNGASIAKASAGASPKNVVTAGMTAFINPREEWRQIFVEAWRLQRDFLYVENMHGVDWSGVRYRYEKMLDDCVTREDLSYVIREMIAELNIGHAYYFGGDGETEPSVGIGMLGVDYSLENGTYRIARICRGAVWDVDARNPLEEPGIDVKVGDYLLAVNGVPVDTDRDPWAPFIGTAGRTITITVSEKPEFDEDARDVAVKPIGSESNLRYREWIEHNRAIVDENSDGQVGYIYVPNTGVAGQSDLVRQYFGQIDKKALIIDERWNGGGQIPTRFIEMLNRPITNYWARRDNRDWKWPPDAHHGPKCMLINGLAGSGGDMFPWLFKQAGLGKLIGTRTWGGLVGMSGNPSLIDGGVMTVPTFGFYEKDGTWGVEGHGVDPDVEVIDNPALMVDGGDPQLDAAIELMLQEIARNPYAPPTRPDAPDRSGMGVTAKDR